MDSESRAAADLLAALCRAAEGFAKLRHPFIRREPLSRLDPARAVVGTDFVLPDGRMVRFAVTLAAGDDGFRVGGEVSVEERVLLDLPAHSTAAVREALAVFDDYTAEVLSRAPLFLEELIEEISA
ncbi:hypothetical protein DP939_42390 [Spongiactinospora rosea]|uniref:Uncharacterized protein n=1 Tax=Spongiactinospora rosea TaxID=2248750 RepID=A0A366LJQ3_9ACTN|nr:hypothetical protein [Spongiactinospora rosea]RBQ14116.1 hypothetical protein DP939_42390 [Spongiactinospora rosea]